MSRQQRDTITAAPNPRPIRPSDDTHDAVAALGTSSSSPPPPPPMTTTTTTKGADLLRWKGSTPPSGAYFPPFLLKKVLAEAIATFLLVFVTCGSAAMSRSNEGLVSKLGASVAGGLIVTVMIYAVGHISGAHMNPAVTFAFAALRHFPWRQVPFYMAAQLSGATAASFTLRELLHPVADVGTTTPVRTATQALVMEIVVTFSMMFVTSAVATDTKAVGELAGLAVGSAVCITSIVAGPISGGSMNPARSIGPALASGRYDGLWVYLVGPFIGTLMGCGSYSLIRVPHGPLSSPTPQGRSGSFKLRRLESQTSATPTTTTTEGSY